MSDIQTCLAAFAVASWANNDVGRQMADQAVDDYLSSFTTPNHHSALAALKSAYEALKLDSHVAIEIIAHIDDRMASLPGGGSRDRHSNE